jgi:2,3-bisphosphoglycerate-dependent phosphoglycerate mutase
MEVMVTLILLRHGQSMWNLENLFTGWVDVPLSKQGVEEAIQAGKKIKDLPIDVIFVSSLIRSQMTAMLAMLEHSNVKTPIMIDNDDENMKKWSKNYGDESKLIAVYKSKELNERMYGELQGLNKAETIKKYGAEQVHIWRRSFDVVPPGGESLEMTAKRSIPYFENYILKELKNNKNVFVAAHGNSLRSIIMHIEGLTKEEVLKLELQTGEPVIYNFDGKTFKRQ